MGTITYMHTEQESPRRIWEIVGDVSAMLSQLFPQNVTLARRGLRMAENSIHDFPLPSAVPPIPAFFTWVIRSIKPLPEDGLVALSFQRLETVDAPSSSLPQVHLFLEDSLIPAQLYSQESAGTDRVEIRFEVDKPEWLEMAVFRMQQEMPHPGQIHIRLYFKSQSDMRLL